jgi:catechol 2,3-dioxygenase-like lactoylglutathione lyase family enzyme
MAIGSDNNPAEDLTVAPVAVETSVRFHLSLNVTDLERSITFYSVLFDREPAKRRSDYAKFELDDPPLVLSLEPTPRPSGGPLNHLGFRLPDAAALVALQERLERAGIRSQREEGVECCYAKQTKFWVTDPDRTLWELYVLEGDIDHRGAGQDEDVVLHSSSFEPPAPAAANVTWQHVMTDPVPETISLADGAADEVLLRGTFNLPLDPATRARTLREALRVLRPGGRLFVHTLTGDRPMDGRPSLPGPAALVQFVPVGADLIREVASAGFQGLRLAKYGAAPCFTQFGVEMRETQMEAYKPFVGTGRCEVLYKGPFGEVTDDAGNVYPRGRRVSVPAAAADLLRQGPLAEQFLVFDGAPMPGACSA